MAETLGIIIDRRPWVEYKGSTVAKIKQIEFLLAYCRTWTANSCLKQMIRCDFVTLIM